MEGEVHNLSHMSFLLLRTQGYKYNFMHYYLSQGEAMEEAMLPPIYYIKDPYTISKTEAGA